MASNVSRGADAKNKTRKWLTERGYIVWDMEVVRTIWKSGRPAFSIKKDQCASDLGAMNAAGVVFVQVKSGKTAIGGTFPAARRAFDAFAFAKGSRQIIIAWPPGASIPRIIEALPYGEWREVKAK